jgi:hypothetical protein
MPDFNEVKRIPVADIAARYGVKLTGRGKWRYGQCPLPSHDPKKLKDAKFGVNTEKNYWTCFSDSCKQRREGNEWGDGVSLVAVLDGCGAKDAAEKLAEWFLSAPKDTPTVAPAESKGESYMKQVDAWFDELTKRREDEDGEAYLKRVRNGVKSKLIESFKNGKAAGQPGRSAA